MKTRTTCLMDWEVGYSTSNPAPYRAWRVKLGILTELKTIFVLWSVVDPSQLHRVRLDLLVNDQHICQKVHDEFLLVSAL